MSIHSSMTSQFSNPQDLLSLLNAQGISYQDIPNGYDKSNGRALAFAIQARIAGENVMAYQTHPGTAIIFQSGGWWFRDKQAVAELAVQTDEQRAQARERQRIADQNRQRELEQQAAEREQQAERRRQQDLERQRLDEQHRQEEEEQKQIEEEQRRIEAEQKRIEEERRQQALSNEASELAERFMQKSRPEVAITQDRGSEPPNEMPKNAAELNQVLGRLQQQNARQKVLDSMSHLEEEFGLSLAEEQRDDDDAVVLILRG